MSISYNIGGALGGKRINSVVLNCKGDNQCEMQVQTAYSGMIHNDSGDFKERVEKALKNAPPTAENQSMVQIAAAAGVQSVPLSNFALRKLRRGGLVLGYSGYAPQAIWEATQRLCDALLSVPDLTS